MDGVPLYNRVIILNILCKEAMRVHVSCNNFGAVWAFCDLGTHTGEGIEKVATEGALWPEVSCLGAAG